MAEVPDTVDLAVAALDMPTTDEILQDVGVRDFETRDLAAYAVSHGVGNTIRDEYGLESLGSTVVGNSPSWLYIHGNVLYVAVVNDSEIQSFDISDGVPVLLDDVTVGTATAWLEQRGKYLFATDTNAAVLRTINVSNPASMSVTTTTTIDSAGNGMAGRFGLQRRGRLMLIGGPESGVNDNVASLVDVSVPTAPVVLSTVSVGGTHRGICAVGANHFALTSRDDHTVYLIDVSNPLLPGIVGSCVTTVSNTTAGVACQGNYIYIADYGNGTSSGGFEIWDVTRPEAPLQAGTLATVGGLEQLVVRGHRVYVSGRDSLVTLTIDVSNKAKPVLVDSTAVGSYRAPGIAVGNGYIYRTDVVANGSQVGAIVTFGMTDDLVSRIAALEELLSELLGVSAVA